MNIIRGTTTTDHLAKLINGNATLPYPINDNNVSPSVSGHVRCDTGCDESVASPDIANRAVSQRIGRPEAMNPVTIQADLTNAD